MVRVRQRLLPISFLGVLGIYLGWASALVLPKAAYGSDKTPSAEEIVARAIEAHGGLKQLRREVPLVRVEEGEMLIEGDKIPFKGEWQLQPPDRQAGHVVIKIGGLTMDVRMGISGDQGWLKYGPAAVTDMNPAELAGRKFQHNNHVLGVRILPGVFERFEHAPPEAVRFADRHAWKIEFTRKTDRQVTSLFFDKGTGVVAGSESVHLIPSLGDKTREKPATFRVIFKSYLDVEGVKMHGALSVLRDGKPHYEIDKVQMQVVEKVDPKLFAKPQ